MADVLRLLAPDDLDWMALYKVVEIIESDLGGGEEAIRKKGWATKAQQSTFGTSANHPGMSVPSSGALLTSLENDGLLAPGRENKLGRGFFYVPAPRP